SLPVSLSKCGRRTDAAISRGNHLACRGEPGDRRAGACRPVAQRTTAGLVVRRHVLGPVFGVGVILLGEPRRFFEPVALAIPVGGRLVPNARLVGPRLLRRDRSGRRTRTLFPLSRGRRVGTCYAHLAG